MEFFLNLYPFPLRALGMNTDDWSLFQGNVLLWWKWLRDKLAVWAEFMLMYAECFRHTVPKETKHSGTAAAHYVPCFHSGKIQLLGSAAMHSLPCPGVLQLPASTATLQTFCSLLASGVLYTLVLFFFLKNAMFALLLFLLVH